jgi:hypothetical protein
LMKKRKKSHVPIAPSYLLDQILKSYNQGGYHEPRMLTDFLIQ